MTLYEKIGEKWKLQRYKNKIKVGKMQEFYDIK